MISRFFIDRPIFANVIAIVTIIFGLVTVSRLPVEQYPQVVPPTVQVSTSYPGANAEVVADTVAAPIEQQVNGVERMLYMSSTSASDGSYKLTVTFEVGTNLDTAQVLVQNRVAIAEPLLPDEVKRQGVTTKKVSTNIIMFVVLTSPDGRYDSLYLANYATLRLRDELSRIAGVGDTTVVGASQYSMRVWLDPEKMKARSLTTEDVVAAIREQNVQVAAGQLGQPPVPTDQTFQFTVNTLGRLSDVEQFEDIIVKSEGTRVTRLRDVARVELGAQLYDTFFQKNGTPAAGIAVFQLPGANALDVADDVRAMMERLKPSFPEGPRVRHPLRHHALRSPGDPRGVSHAHRGGRPGADRDPALPPGLARGPRAGDDGAGHDHRRLRRHGGDRLHGQSPHALRPGARDRHRRRRRDRDRRERRAPHRGREAFRRARRRFARWTR